MIEIEIEIEIEKFLFLFLFLFDFPNDTIRNNKENIPPEENLHVTQGVFT